MLRDWRLLASLLIAWILAPPGLARRLRFSLPLAVWVGLLNPHVTGWVGANVTGPAYWRSLWALPLPVLMTLVLTATLHRGRSGVRPWVGPMLCVALLAAFALLIPRYGGLSPANRVRLGWPGLKVPPGPFRWAALVNESVPSGAAVAVPVDIGTWAGRRNDGR